MAEVSGELTGGVERCGKAMSNHVVELRRANLERHRWLSRRTRSLLPPGKKNGKRWGGYREARRKALAAFYTRREEE